MTLLTLGVSVDYLFLIASQPAQKQTMLAKRGTTPKTLINYVKPGPYTVDEDCHRRRPGGVAIALLQGMSITLDNEEWCASCRQLREYSV